MRGGGGVGGDGDAISSIKYKGGVREPVAPGISEGAKLLSRLR